MLLKVSRVVSGSVLLGSGRVLVGFSLWCCVQAAVWADVVSRSPADRSVAVTTAVLSTASAARILTMSAPLVRTLSSHNDTCSVFTCF